MLTRGDEGKEEAGSDGWGVQAPVQLNHCPPVWSQQASLHLDLDGSPIKHSRHTEGRWTVSSMVLSCEKPYTLLFNPTTFCRLGRRFLSSFFFFFCLLRGKIQSYYRKLETRKAHHTVIHSTNAYWEGWGMSPWWKWGEAVDFIWVWWGLTEGFEHPQNSEICSQSSATVPGEAEFTKFSDSKSQWKCRFPEKEWNLGPCQAVMLSPLWGQ